ncbi:hypothetical protein [Nocardia callitridis]
MTISDSVQQIHDLDLAIGGDRLCTVAANQVRLVELLLESGTYTESVGQSLMSVGAEMMTATGWVHFDSGRFDAARRYYADAANAANAAGDGVAAAHALGNATFLMVCGSDESSPAAPAMAVQYAQAASKAALREGGPKLRALMAIREAEAHAARGEHKMMTAAISRAHRAYESTRGHDPEWVHLPKAEFLGGVGWAQMRIGDHCAATENLRAAVDAAVEWPRERAALRTYLAQNLVNAGDVAQACELLAANMAAMSGLSSTRLRRRIGSLANQVRRHASVSEVREFLGQCATRL